MARLSTAAAIHRRMRRLAEPGRAAVLQRFFKTAPGDYGAGDRFLGLTVPAVRRLAADYVDLPMREVTRLLRSPWHEERLLALLILVRQYADGDAATRASIYRCYLRHRARINNWDLVDVSAEHIVGAHLRRGDRRILRQLAASPSVWDRRIAMLSTFHDIKAGEYDKALAMARALLDDPSDLVQKAVGWMLREVGKRNRRIQEQFLRTYATRMPRTMLRYAIERLPETARRRYLSRR